MYQIKCDDFHLYDYRLPDLIVTDPKVKIAVNTVGEASFTIHNNHPYYSKLKVLKSIFEISDEIGVIFRGRMTNNSQDFHNSKAVDLEGLMAFFNDSAVRPFKFPEDFKTDTEYISATQNGNVIKFFLKWLIDNHNSQVEDFQKFKLGNVTVSDPNNYITRSESKYSSTWEILKTKLFESSLGGYLCIRYEADGNYIDYLKEFELTNTQEINYGENLIDLKNEIDAASTYSAIIPLGAEIETEETNENGEKVKKTLTLSGISDGQVAPGVMKKGDAIYSPSARDDFGWICAPTELTTWQDVTEVNNLLKKGIEYLTGEGIKLSNNIEINAVDLHFNDAEIRSFRLYRNIKVNSLPHNQEALLPLTSLEIDLLRPQNTKIVVGKVQKTLSEITNDRYKDALDHIQNATDDLKGKVSVTQSNLNDLNTKIEGAIEGTYLYIMYSPYEDGHEMTTDPEENTMYMGTCSTSSTTRPTNYKEYTWVKVRGLDGNDGTPGLPGTNQYFHIRYSDDGINFTANNGEVLGDWMGTCVDNNEDDPEDFDAYTWHRIKGEQGVPGHDGIGIDGTSSYFHIRYSEVENPTTKEQMTENPSKYIGTYVDNNEDDSDDPKDYKWSQFMGTDGIPGEDGQNGQTYYLHIKYSDDGGQSFTANNGETSGKYIGVYTDTTQADSTSVSKYTWSLLKGADGKDGQITYTWIKYADSPTSGMTDNPEGKTYMGIAYNKTTKTESTTYSDYTWSLIRGADGSDGVNGTNGKDGKTYYTWVKYADDDKGTNMSDNPTNKKYIGLAYNKTTSTESTTASDYSWALFRGEDGVDGQNQYFYVRYSKNSIGYPMTVEPDAETKYMGVCATTSPTAPESYTDYEWSLVKGDQGIPGQDGKDGKTQYWHIKYSDDGVNFTANNGETLGAWIGTYVDFNEADSLVFSDYTWKKFTEDVDAELDDIRTVISSQQTDIQRNEAQINLIASRSYIETSAFEQYKEEVSSEFNQTVDQIDMKFTTTTQQINNVDGDLQSKFEKISKHISFNENGISIGGGSNAMLLTVDNENGIIFSKNGTPFGWWDGVDFHTGNIVVEVNERAQFGNFAFVPRTDGSLSFLKVGGNSGDAHTHNYIETILTAATCTNTGTKTRLCSGCKDSSTITLPALGHNYTSVVTPPTETAQGYTTYTCIRCGDSYKSNYTPATGGSSSGGSSSGGSSGSDSGSGGTTNYTVKTVVSPSGAGTVTGAGTYASGTTIQPKATPESGYIIKGWIVKNDDTGEEDNSLENLSVEKIAFTVDYNATITAIFESTSGDSTILKISAQGKSSSDFIQIYECYENSTGAWTADYTKPLGTTTVLTSTNNTVALYAKPGSGRKIASYDALLDGVLLVNVPVNSTAEFKTLANYDSSISEMECKFYFEQA